MNQATPQTIGGGLRRLRAVTKTKNLIGRNGSDRQEDGDLEATSLHCYHGVFSSCCPFAIIDHCQAMTGPARHLDQRLDVDGILACKHRTAGSSVEAHGGEAEQRSIGEAGPRRGGTALGRVGAMLMSSEAVEERQKGAEAMPTTSESVEGGCHLLPPMVRGVLTACRAERRSAERSPSFVDLNFRDG